MPRDAAAAAGEPRNKEQWGARSLSRRRPSGARAATHEPPKKQFHITNKYRGLGCCIRVTPWVTALSVVLIGAGLPFW
jgi:hypothetical protein